MKEKFDDCSIPNENDNNLPTISNTNEIRIKNRISLKKAVEKVIKKYRLTNKIEQTISDALILSHNIQFIRKSFQAQAVITDVKQKQLLQRKSKISNYQTQLTKQQSTISNGNQYQRSKSAFTINRSSKVSDIQDENEVTTYFDQIYQRDYFKNILGDDDQELNIKLQQMYKLKNKIEDKQDIRDFSQYYQQHFKTFYKSKVLKSLTLHKSPVKQIRFSPNGKMFASCCEGGTLKIWDFKTQNLIQSMETSNTKFLCLNFTLDNMNILVGCDDSSVKVWELNNIILQETLFNHSEKINSIDIMQQYYASGSDDNLIQIVSLDDFQVKQTLNGHLSGVTCLVHTLDQKMLISGGQDAKINIWDVDKNFILAYTLLGHQNTLLSIHIYESRLISSSQDKKIKIYNQKYSYKFFQKLWDLNLNQCVKTLQYEFEVKEFTISYDKQLMLGACNDGSIRLWNLSNFNNEQTFIQHEKCVNSVQYSPDMSIFVSGSDDTKVNLWHASTYQISNSFVANNICVRSMIFLKFKDEFLLGGEDGSVSRWKYTFKRIQSQTHHQMPVTNLSLSKQEDKFLSSSIYDPMIILWDATNFLLLSKFINPSGFTLCIEFLNENIFLIGQSSGNLDVWELSNQSPKIQRYNHLKAVNCICICYNQEQFITGTKIFNNHDKYNLIFGYSATESIPLFNTRVLITLSALQCQFKSFTPYHKTKITDYILIQDLVIAKLEYGSLINMNFKIIYMDTKEK